MQAGLAWSRFKLTESTFEAQPELVTSPSPHLNTPNASVSPLHALNPEQRHSSCGNPSVSSSGGGWFITAQSSLNSENYAIDKQSKIVGQKCLSFHSDPFVYFVFLLKTSLTKYNQNIWCFVLITFIRK